MKAVFVQTVVASTSYAVSRSISRNRDMQTAQPSLLMDSLKSMFLFLGLERPRCVRRPFMTVPTLTWSYLLQHSALETGENVREETSKFRWLVFDQFGD